MPGVGCIVWDRVPFSGLQLCYHQPQPSKGSSLSASCHARVAVQPGATLAILPGNQVGPQDPSASPHGETEQKGRKDPTGEQAQVTSLPSTH